MHANTHARTHACAHARVRARTHKPYRVVWTACPRHEPLSGLPQLSRARALQHSTLHVSRCRVEPTPVGESTTYLAHAEAVAGLFHERHGRVGQPRT
jgi:hypothetical protein